MGQRPAASAAAHLLQLLVRVLRALGALRRGRPARRRGPAPAPAVPARGLLVVRLLALVALAVPPWRSRPAPRRSVRPRGGQSPRALPQPPCSAPSVSLAAAAVCRRSTSSRSQLGRAFLGAAEGDASGGPPYTCAPAIPAVRRGATLSQLAS